MLHRQIDRTCSPEMAQKISELWHISRSALSSKKHGRYERMRYVQEWLSKDYPERTSKELWVIIDRETQLFREI